ncbi:putative disease resistance protein RGA4 [Vitis vinifera]|uniref:Putative disease resistance protein RGA4 n=1 Tax=Vitis vinifera TaxID=29760 RepID=A0A438JKR8_VITVI|nr:putative disease resistance protein RGA4 [Vitis vinifera]
MPMERGRDVLHLCASLALQEVALAWGVQADLEDLKNTISTIQAVISDAEEQQSKIRQLSDWLRKLNNALYEAKDVLDEFEYRGFTAESCKRWEHRKTADKSKFNLTERVVVVDGAHVVHRKREMAHSYVDASNIIGRDQDKENIVSILMQSSSDEQENVSVIPIIGIGGLGKTTLAKLVYNDERVVAHFDKRMWACVSDENFEIEKLTKKILMSATRGSAAESYLLVLDDVWNNDREKWLELKELLMGGAGGSKIVVTTRKNSVASIMDGQIKHYPNLVKLGDEIVKRCGGVPLAVRALGGFLFRKVDEHVWVSVRDNEIWKSKEDRILPVLKFSYDELPSYLKQCFAFCSLFPKDFEFNNRELIQFWLAHGLIQPSSQNQDLEDIAQFEQHTLDAIEKINSNEVQHVLLSGDDPEENCQRYGELDQSDVLVDNHKAKSFVGDREWVGMLNFSSFFIDLRMVSKSGVFANKCKTPACIREPGIWDCERLNLMDGDGDSEDDIQGSSSRLCTFIIGALPQLEALPQWLVQGPTTSNLHCLGINGCHNFKGLPESLENLTSLQELRIGDCPQLSTLTEGMHRLTTLKVLSIDDCPELSKRCMPK